MQLLIVYIALFLFCLRVLYVVWYSLLLIRPLPSNRLKHIPSDYSFIQPGTLILTKIKSSLFSVNHLSLALSNDRIFECMPTKKKLVRYHFFSFHAQDILPKLIGAADHIAIRQPLVPLNALEIARMADLQMKASTLHFNYLYEVDLFRHRIFGIEEDDIDSDCLDGNKSFCSQYISILLRSVKRFNVNHNWSFPGEFSSNHPNDVLKGHYGPNLTIP